MVQLAVPRELTVGALLLRPAAGEIGKRDALIGKLALLNEIGVRSARQADGEVIARALVGTGGKRKLAVLVRRTGGLGKVEPQAADLGQILGVQPSSTRISSFGVGSVTASPGVAGVPQAVSRSSRDRSSADSFFIAASSKMRFRGDPYFISSATRSVYSLGSSSGRPAMSSA